ESSVGRYTFSVDKYCEWIVYTVRNNLDKPGVTNESPAVTDHCTSVTLKDGRFSFSPPGEGVEVSFGAEGFIAKIGGEFVDHWRKIRWSGGMKGLPRRCREPRNVLMHSFRCDAKLHFQFARWLSLFSLDAGEDLRSY